MRLLLALPLILLSFAAHAQTPQMPYTWPVTVGTSQSSVMVQNTSRRRIEFFNASDTAKIAVCPAISRSNSAPINCTVNGPGSITLVPYTGYKIDGVGNSPLVPSAWNAIASAPNSALTIFEWE